MTHQLRTFADLVSLDSTTGAIDTTEIQELSAAMPRDGNIDLNNAEVMATKYLRGADLCSELMAVATAQVGKAKDAKQRAYNYAFVVKTQQHPHLKTDKMRIAFAELDEDYQSACEKFNEASAFYKWINSKYESFIRMHYMCKKILDRGYAHERASGFNGDFDKVANENLEDSWEGI